MRMARRSILSDTWLKIPQAVVLEVTGNLQQAKDLDDDDPNLLLIKAILRLRPLVSIDFDDVSIEMESMRQKYREAIEARSEESVYEKGVRNVHAKLVQGVTAKGSRAPNSPVEVIDPAEFARLELRGIDAFDIRTGKPVWYNLMISARDLLESNSQAGAGCEGVVRAHTPLVWARDGTTPLSDRELRAWYQERIRNLLGLGKTASGEADWEAVKRRYLGRVTRARIRALREELAPADWKKQGRRSLLREID
jgi:hypothetical protein